MGNPPAEAVPHRAAPAVAAASARGLAHRLVRRPRDRPAHHPVHGHSCPALPPAFPPAPQASPRRVSRPPATAQSPALLPTAPPVAQPLPHPSSAHRYRVCAVAPPASRPPPPIHAVTPNARREAIVAPTARTRLRKHAQPSLLRRVAWRRLRYATRGDARGSRHHPRHKVLTAVVAAHP